MNEVIEWLSSESRNYSKGVAMYETHGSNRNLLRFFRASENITSRQALYDELKKIAREAGHKVLIAPVVVVAKEQAKQKKIIAQEQEPKKEYMSLVDAPEVEELIKTQGHLFRQKEILRKKLYDFPHNNQKEVIAERAMVMEQIINFKSQIAEIAVKRKFYQANGYLPSEVDTSSKDYLIQALKNARSNVSRQKTAIKNATSIDAKITAEKRLATYERKRDEIEKKLL